MWDMLRRIWSFLFGKRKAGPITIVQSCLAHQSTLSFEKRPRSGNQLIVWVSSTGPIKKIEDNHKNCYVVASQKKVGVVYESVFYTDISKSGRPFTITSSEMIRGAVEVSGVAGIDDLDYAKDVGVVVASI
jgi:hypothetical protein